MNRVFVCGIGAVSPAGWGVAAMRDALAKGEPIPVQPLDRPGWTAPFKVRAVPAPAARPTFLTHPRLRRTSPITQYAAGAALEAAAPVRSRRADCRLGIVTCLQSGCVQFSYRFFDEALKDPATASPLVFPETVFAAPGSHVAALLQNVPLSYTLMGDPAAVLQAVAIAVEWLEEKRVDACLVLGAEEINWLRADALWQFDHRAVMSAGAGAVCLSLDPRDSIGVELNCITEAFTYSAQFRPPAAARAMREALRGNAADEILCEGLQESGARMDGPELAAWRDWSGPRLSLKRVLGEGLVTAAAWQCVAACDAVAQGSHSAVTVSLVGCNQQAIGARFVKHERDNSPLSATAPTGTIAS